MSRAPQLRAVPSPEASLDLLPQHKHKLFESSGIDPRVAAERGYRSIEDPVALTRAPYDFSPRQAEQVPAILIPLWDVTGENTHNAFRPDVPSLDDRGKPRKYQMPPRKGVIVDVPPRVHRSGIFDDYGEELWITESPLKADAAVSRGLNCISVWGVWSWRAKTRFGGTAVLPDFEKISWQSKEHGNRGRPVYLVFDSDTRSNIQVSFGRARLVNWLRLLGADVWVVDLPPDRYGAKQGLDDYFVNGGTVERLRADAIPGDERFRIIEMDEFAFTDIGNAERFAWLFNEMLRSVDGSREWLVWRGAYWDIAEEEDVLSLAMEVPTYVEEQAKLLSPTVPEGEKASPQDKRRSAARRLESYNTLTSMTKTARGLASFRTKGSQLDSDPWLFNAANGTINLKTGQLITPHRPSDLITNLAPASYIEGHHDERWERFLNDITEGDKDYLAFLQRALGMSLVGETTFEGLFFAYGGTATGKSTFFDAIRGAWGDYGAVANFKSFLRTRDGTGEGPRPDLYKLIGKRLITSAEVEKGAALAADLIKQLTGGSGEITVRDLYGKSNQYRTWRPTSLWLAANDRPHVDSSEEAIWRRIWTLPFLHSVHGKKTMDESLKPYLRDPKHGGAAVLAWAVEGCLLWQNEGRKLDQPKIITQANEDYRNEMDPYVEWKESLEIGPEYRALTAHLHASFQLWCDENSVSIGRLINPSSFGKWIKKQFTLYGKSYPDQGSTMLTGIGIPDAEKEQIERYARHLRNQRRRTQ